MYLVSNRYCVNWFENYIKINEHFNSFERLASNFSLEYYTGIKHGGHKSNRNDHWPYKLLSVLQILLVRTSGNV